MEMIKTFLDAEGRLVRWPSKRSKKLAALLYLAERFTPGVSYTEREVNDLLDDWHTYHDPATLRRELFAHGLICRERDGSRYWLPDVRPTYEDLSKLYG